MAKQATQKTDIGRSLRTIWISEGDPTGINLEMMEANKALFKNWSERLRIIFVHSAHTFFPSYFTNATGENPAELGYGLYRIEIDNLSPAESKKLRPGLPSIPSAICSMDSLTLTLSLLKKHGGDLLTLPLSKEWILRAGYKKFRGHTEYLADFFGTKTYMLMTGKHLKVLPLTTHIPLKSVPKALLQFSWSDISHALLGSFTKGTKIGILGLNPHAGEGGKIGDEEILLLKKGAKSLKKMGFAVSEPLSADSAFIGYPKLPYDVYLSCYHDQGLIPFKLLEGKRGINKTLGLPFVRVSPDHGPAFSIAGKGIADSVSVKSCMEHILET